MTAWDAHASQGETLIYCFFFKKYIYIVYVYIYLCMCIVYYLLRVEGHEYTNRFLSIWICGTYQKKSTILMTTVASKIYGE